MLNTRLVAPLVLALALAGCGTHLGRPTATTLASHAVQARSRDQAADLIAGLRTMAAQLNTFSATVGFWETKDGQTQTSTADVWTARPGKIRANITASSQPLKKGAKLVYLGDKVVTVKIAFVKRTLPYDDPQATSMHNWRIDQTDLAALITGLTDTAGQATLAGPNAVSVTSPTLLPGVTREVVVLDPATFMPQHFEAYMGDAVVYKLDITHAQQNPVLPGDIFDL